MRKSNTITFYRAFTILHVGRRWHYQHEQLDVRGIAKSSIEAEQAIEAWYARPKGEVHIHGMTGKEMVRTAALWFGSQIAIFVVLAFRTGGI